MKLLLPWGRCLKQGSLSAIVISVDKEEDVEGNQDRVRMSLRAWWQAHGARLLQLWGVGILCSLLVTAASVLGYLEPLQARSLDLILRLQGRRPASAVVIVAIDEAAFASLGRRQPLARD
jgi:CHASE2 domain-containing sensor protein